ncbi:hypothetical protein H0H87_006662 [Tephrocybe sp. NHM501043]|nr:hypothetical protein H0H87_006662 [Tephrocybe sp. NHM501043]
MHTGATTAESYTYSSLFSYARPVQISSAAAIHPANEHSSEQNASGHRMATANSFDDENIDDLAEIPQMMSASCSADPVSSSPAAMFLSAFSSPKQSVPLPDAEGHVVCSYTLGSIIGHGAFSTIRRAFSPSGDVVAVKIIRRSDHFKRGEDAAVSKKRIKHEAQVWETLSHEHILPLFSAAHTSYADYFFTLFCPAGSLYDILKRDGRPELPQDDVGMMFRQVVRGLRYLHEVALFVHRDIKLENVLVDECGVCRIGDFGLTKRIGEIDEDEEVQEQRATEPFQHGNATVHRAVSLLVPGTKVGPKGSSLHAQLARHRNSTSSVHSTPAPVKFQPGSLPYAAPELLLPQTGPVIPHPSQDIWALGVLLYTLLTGRLPFTDSFEPRLQMKILNGTYDVPPGIGRGAERVLKGCLDRSDTTRWHIAMVDEVAWGVGWGSENDDVTPADSDEEFIPSQPRSHSRHRLEVAIPEDPEWQQEEPSLRPALDAASRRSSSRIQRSLSRAPHSAKRPTLNRSASRHSRAPSPSFPSFDSSAARSPSVVRSPSNNVRSPSSTRSPYFFDTNLDNLDTTSAFERGRRRQKYSQSFHSPSPSIAAPTTPSDSLDPDPIDRSASRGRRRKVEFTTTPLPDHIYTGDELETLDEASQTPAFTQRSERESAAETFIGRRTQRSQSKPAYHPTHAYGASTHRNKRSGSTPPPNGEACQRPLSGNAVLNGFGKFPMNKVLKPVQPTTAVDRRTRSRSLDVAC